MSPLRLTRLTGRPGLCATKRPCPMADSRCIGGLLPPTATFSKGRSRSQSQLQNPELLNLRRLTTWRPRRTRPARQRLTPHNQVPRHRVPPQMLTPRNQVPRHRVPPQMLIAAPPGPLPTAAPAETASEGRAPSSSYSFAPRRNSATTGSQRIAEATRILIFAATLGIVGGLAFMALVVRDEPLDSDRARRWVGASGIVLAVSAVAASLNRAVEIEREWSAFWSPDAIGDAVSSHFGMAAGLRLVGGLVLAVALLRAAAKPPRRRAVATALLGGALVIASFAFDGHTVTEGPRWLHSVASVSHVGAAAVWSGGVVLLADLLWRRHRRGADVISAIVAIFPNGSRGTGAGRRSRHGHGNPGAQPLR